MYRICNDASARVPGYYPADFRKALDDCGGDFAPRAKQFLRAGIQDGLLRLAKAGAFDVSMEWVIAREPEWIEFNEEDRQLAEQRMELARKMVGK